MMTNELLTREDLQQFRMQLLSELKEVLQQSKQSTNWIPSEPLRKRAELIEDIGGVTVNIVSYEDLILNKRTVNRKTDQSYIDALKKVRSNKRKGRGI